MKPGKLTDCKQRVSGCLMQIADCLRTSNAQIASLPLWGKPSSVWESLVLNIKCYQDGFNVSRSASDQVMNQREGRFPGEGAL